MSEVTPKIKYKLYGALRLHLKICRLLGLAPIKETPNGIEFSIIYIIISWIIILIINSMIIAGFIFDVYESNRPLHGRTLTFRIVRMANLLILMTITCVGVYGAPKRLKCVMNALVKIETIKHRIGIKNTKEREKYQFIVIYSFIVVIFVLIILELYRHIYEELQYGRDVKTLLMNSVFSVEYVIQELLVLQFMLIATQLQNLLQDLNGQLQDIKNHVDIQLGTFELKPAKRDFKINSVMKATDTLNINYLKLDIEDNFYQKQCKKVRLLVQFYENICDIIERLSTGYELLILLLLASFYLGLVISPYYEIFTNIYAVIQKPAFLLLRIFWFILHFLSLVILVEPCHQTQLEMERTRVLVGQLLRRIHTNGSELHDELEMFCQVLLLKYSVYSPFGVCVLNRSLIVTIMGAVTTYLVIIFQFQTNSADDDQQIKLTTI